MSIANAQKFVREIKQNRMLNEKVCRAYSDFDVLELALQANYEFTYEEYFAARGLESMAMTTLSKSEKNDFVEIEINEVLYALSGW